MVVVHIVAWDLNHGWTDWSGYKRGALERRLLRYMSRCRQEAKGLVQKIHNHECVDLVLDKATDKFAAESLRSLLESLGAVVRMEDDE